MRDMDEATDKVEVTSWFIIELLKGVEKRNSILSK